MVSRRPTAENRELWKQRDRDVAILGIREDRYVRGLPLASVIRKWAREHNPEFTGLRGVGVLSVREVMDVVFYRIEKSLERTELWSGEWG